jgi:hypothetical protein
MSQSAKPASNAQAKKSSKPQESSSALPPKKPARQPEKRFGPFAGGIGVSVWINTAQTEDGPRAFRSITLNPRRYFDRETNEWRDAPSYNPTDLPALIFALERAQAYVFETPLPGSAAEGESPEASSAEEIPF